MPDTSDSYVQNASRGSQGTRYAAGRLICALGSIGCGCKSLEDVVARQGFPYDVSRRLDPGGALCDLLCQGGKSVGGWALRKSRECVRAGAA